MSVAFACGTSVKQCMLSEAPNLATIKKELGEPEAQRTLMLIIAQYSQLINVGKNISPDQIKMITPMLIRDYYYLNLSEWFYLLEQGMKGKLYDKFDYNTICTWIEDYVSKRVEEFEHLNDHLHHRFKHNNLDYKKWFDDIAAKSQKKEGKTSGHQQFFEKD